jgi:ABC-2 type transport system permease protein
MAGGRKLLSIVWHSLLMRLSDGGLLLAVVVAPLLVSLLINLALGDYVLGRGVPEARLGVALVNQDEGAQWGNLGAAFEQALLPGADSPEPYARLFTARTLADPARAQRLVSQGQLIAALVVPPDFSRALADEEAVLHVYVDGGDEILGAAFGSAVDTYAGLISVGEVAVRTTTEVLRQNPALRARLQAGEFDEALADLAVQAAKPETNPVQIVSAARPAQGVGVRLTHYFAATIAIVLVGLFTLMSSASLYQEKTRGTLRRAYASPTRPGTIVWGKTVAGWLGGLLLMAVLIAGMAAIEVLLGTGRDDPPPDAAGLALLAAATVTAATGFGVAVAGLCRTYAQVAGYGRALVIVMGLVGGIFFPVALLPAPLRLVSRLTYQYWAMDGYLKLALGGGTGDVLLPAAVLVAIGVLGTAVGSVLLRRHVALGC